MADRGRNSRDGYRLLAPTLMVMGLALAAPLLLMAITSLKSQSGLTFAQGWTLACQVMAESDSVCVRFPD